MISDGAKKGTRINFGCSRDRNRADDGTGAGDASDIHRRDDNSGSGRRRNRKGLSCWYPGLI
jgi:hypothetical protein